MIIESTCKKPIRSVGSKKETPSAGFGSHIFGERARDDVAFSLFESIGLAAIKYKDPAALRCLIMNVMLPSFYLPFPSPSVPLPSPLAMCPS